ncbi:MAG: DUF1667 domain-containing protein [Firmicutes bacterium]|nr:DUF1667 domain-containing protein [Bacillota bacterium]
MGCSLEVEIIGEDVVKITGAMCRKGEDYAKKEVINPTRIITSIVPVINGVEDMVSIKTSKDIPKDKIKECMMQLKGIKMTAPIKVGDIVLKNVCGTNVDFIATKNVEVKKNES